MHAFSKNDNITKRKNNEEYSMLVELPYMSMRALHQEHLENCIFLYILDNMLTKLWDLSTKQMVVIIHVHVLFENGGFRRSLILTLSIFALNHVIQWRNIMIT